MDSNPILRTNTLNYKGDKENWRGKNACDRHAPPFGVPGLPLWQGCAQKGIKCNRYCQKNLDFIQHFVPWFRRKSTEKGPHNLLSGKAKRIGLFCINSCWLLVMILLQLLLYLQA